MKLFHFCSSEHIDSIKEEGLTRGSITVINGWGVPKGFIKPCQWLTKNPDWNQSWDSMATLNYSRTDYKIIVDIPYEEEDQLYRWQDIDEISQIAELDGMRDTIETLNRFGDPENWYCYFDEIPPEWFRQIIKNPRIR